MSLIPRDSVFDIDKVFESFFSPQSTRLSGNYSFHPRTDIREKEDGFEIVTDLPGVDKEDLHVHIDDGVLSIEATTSSSHDEKEGDKVVRQERFSGKYVRNFNLGGQVQESDIKADFKNGVLTISIPKASPAEPEKRRIEVN